jgi:tRNA1Val (adenine37-N6)-methyltransferase
MASPAESKAVSRHQLECSLEDIVHSASKLLNYQGRFALIYPAQRMVDLFALLRSYKLEPRLLRFIHSYRESPSRLMLVEARKSAPPELRILPPLIIYKKPGEYEAEILSWYGKEVEHAEEK